MANCHEKLEYGWLFKYFYYDSVLGVPNDYEMWKRKHFLFIRIYMICDPLLSINRATCPSNNYFYKVQTAN